MLGGIQLRAEAGKLHLAATDMEAGVLASLTSLRFAVVSGGVLCVAGCVAAALALPRFLRYDAAASR